MDQLGYTLLKGRHGASGHGTRLGGDCAWQAQGLAPRADYILCIPGKAVTRTLTADHEGCFREKGPWETGAFLARQGQVVLWEAGEGEADRYLRACDWLRRLDAPRRNPASSLPPDAPAPSESTEEKEAVGSPPGEETAVPPPDAPPASWEREPVASSAPYTLRPAGTGEPVDALPALRWPEGTEEIRRYVRVCPPIAPFDAPGWRFFRAPSPVRGVPYGAVGYAAQDDRVTAIAYAVPGAPYRPPAPLPGFRYQSGRGGVGYWVLRREV